MIREEDICDYCDSEFTVEFEDENAEVVFCPFCGEELFNEENELEYEDDEDFDYE